MIRVQRRALGADDDLSKARLYAESAVHMGLMKIKNNSAWRTAYPNGAWDTNKTIGDGTYTLEVADPNDNSLSNSPSHAVTVTGTGIRGASQHKLQVTLIPSDKPLTALNYAITANGLVTILAGKRIRLTGAALAGNGTVTNTGATIAGDVECTLLLNVLGVTGSITQLAPTKPMPDSTVFNLYKAMATTLPYSGDIDKKVITAGVNTYGGGLNTSGVYYIDAGSNDLIIKNSRIDGTLVVKCGLLKKVVIENDVFLRNGRSDFPVLIVDGAVQMNHKSGASSLRKGDHAVNFNPTGAPYLGVTDSDTGNTYPNEIQGLVHIKGNLTMGQTSRVRGAIICEGSVDFQDDSEVIYTPSLSQNPPLYYTVPGEMQNRAIELAAGCQLGPGRGLPS